MPRSCASGWPGLKSTPSRRISNVPQKSHLHHLTKRGSVKPSLPVPHLPARSTSERGSVPWDVYPISHPRSQNLEFELVSRIFRGRLEVMTQCDALGCKHCSRQRCSAQFGRETHCQSSFIWTLFSCLVSK